MLQEETNKSEERINDKPVIYTSWGLADSYDDRIELYEGLRKRKDLRDYIMRHEHGHRKGFDLSHDLNLKGFKFGIIWFVLSNPRTWTSLLPIQYKNKNIVLDFNLGMIYIFSVLMIYGLYYLIKILLPYF